MENQTNNRARLGIFVSIAIALFIIIIYVIGNKRHMFSKTFTIVGNFRDISGLQAGNHVRFSGINIGNIDALEITSDSSVKVIMVLEKNVQKFIKSDASATIGSEGLMGSKVVNIQAGDPASPVIANGGEVATITPISLDDIMVNLNAVSLNAVSITDDISKITFGMRSGKGAIGKLFMDSAFAETLNQTMVNAKNATGGLSENMEAAKHNFLLRGYYKKKEKEAAKAAKEDIKNAAKDAVKK
jgi:phospholipid/cholesterol/gamma-HCH transport system substrate-binding protein